MTPEQLKTARADRWRQQGNPVLTLEDAEGWLEQTGLCLFLPRRSQLIAPAPSFVEATLGRESATPKPQEIAEATALLDRALDAGKLLPLNLLGLLSEQPDFVATEDALPSIFALRGDRDWKNGPKGQSSPLVMEVWKLLDREGALTAAEIQGKLGRELTEAAVHRALNELWGAMRVLPVYTTDSKAGRVVHWEILQTRFQQAMHKGGGMSRVAALSALVSLYLQSAIAATEEEIETFLSPLSSRSKIREAVRGLTATRQLAMTSSGTDVVYHVAGELPEFPQIEATASDIPATGYVPRHEGGKRPAYKRPAFAEDGERKRPAAGAPRRDRSSAPLRDQNAAPSKRDGGMRPLFRKSAGSEETGAPGRSGPRTPGESFRSREGRAASYGQGGRPPFRKAAEGPNAAGGSDPRKSFGAGEGRPYKSQPEGKSRPEGDKPFRGRPAGGDTGERRPYKPRTQGEGYKSREGSGASSGSRPPFRKTDAGSSPRKSFSTGEGRPPYKSRPEGDKPFRGRPVGGDTGERRPYKPRTQGEGFKPREGSGSGYGNRPPFRKTGGATSPRKSFGAGQGRPYKPRSEGRRPFERGPAGGSGSGEGRPYKPRTQGENFRPRGQGGAGAGGGFKSADSRSSFKSGPRPPASSSSRSGTPSRSGGFGKRPAGGFPKRPGAPFKKRSGGAFKRKPREEKGE